MAKRPEDLKQMMSDYDAIDICSEAVDRLVMPFSDSKEIQIMMLPCKRDCW